MSMKGKDGKGGKRKPEEDIGNPPDEFDEDAKAEAGESEKKKKKIAHDGAQVPDEEIIPTPQQLKDSNPSQDLIPTPQAQQSSMSPVLLSAKQRMNLRMDQKLEKQVTIEVRVVRQYDPTMENNRPLRVVNGPDYIPVNTSEHGIAAVGVLGEIFQNSEMLRFLIKGKISWDWTQPDGSVVKFRFDPNKSPLYSIHPSGCNDQFLKFVGWGMSMWFLCLGAVRLLPFGPYDDRMMQTDPQIALEETVKLFQTSIHGSVLYDAPGHPRVSVRVIEQFCTEEEINKFDPSVTQKMLEANRELFKRKKRNGNSNAVGSGDGNASSSSNNRNNYPSNYPSSSFSSPASSGYSFSFTSPAYHK